MSLFVETFTIQHANMTKVDTLKLLATLLEDIKLGEDIQLVSCRHSTPIMRKYLSLSVCLKKDSLPEVKVILF